MLTIYTANFSFRLLPIPRPATTTNSAAIIINSPRYLFFFCRTSFAATAMPSSNIAVLTFPSSFGSFSPANNSATVTSSASASASQTAMSGNAFPCSHLDIVLSDRFRIFASSSCVICFSFLSVRTNPPNVTLSIIHPLSFLFLFYYICHIFSLYSK